ncbi:MAG: hypothetical protein A2X84_08715 [Desulfuromonadaceae bacterium GWC2_58_13]|nr:MAG: hypothetical protein A2X84_08715 [Desulfuromonadaceae bacterium GWC2_58_13]
MTRQLPPTVCLDSSAVRRIREDKKLTQLYVSKVVGVTTDTISRWENNRYPTIKRENALRLAEALEIDVEAILEGGRDEGEGLAEFPSSSRRHYPWLLAVAVLAILSATFFFWRTRQQEAPLHGLAADRWLPRFASPGSVIPVHIRLEPDTGLKGFILREHFPGGWQLIEAIPPPSSLDNEQGNVRWIVKPGEDRKGISYLVKVDERAPVDRMESLAGEIVVGPEGRSKPVPVRGATRIQVSPYHWADLNGDWRIDDGEMLLASDTFEVMKGVHLDWNQLEKLWDSGSYQWDAGTARFVPVKAEPAPDSSSPPLVR